MCFDDFHLLLGGQMLDWNTFQPAVTDSGNWGDGDYPGGNLLGSDTRQYCSAQNSFTPNPADSVSRTASDSCHTEASEPRLFSQGTTSVGTESVTLTMQTPIAAFDAFQLAQDDGMGYNPVSTTVCAAVPFIM